MYLYVCMYIHMYLYVDIKVLCELQGVQEKLCFLTINFNPSLACISVRDLQSSQCNASVQSFLLAGQFFLYIL